MIPTKNFEMFGMLLRRSSDVRWDGFWKAEDDGDGDGQALDGLDTHHAL